MDVSSAPAPAGAWSPPLPQDVTEIMTKDTDMDHGALALIGGLVGSLLLLLVLSLVVLLWCLSRHKGSYVTNETDDSDDESGGSDREPLKTKGDE